MLKGRRKQFPLFKRGGGENINPVFMGGGGGAHKKFRTRDFPVL